MKKGRQVRIALSFFCLILSSHLHMFGGDVELFLDICRYQNNLPVNKGSYISVNMAAGGGSLNWEAVDPDATNPQFQAVVHLDVILRMMIGGDTLPPSRVERFNVSSRVISDTTSIERYAYVQYVDTIFISPYRSPGRYILEVRAYDNQIIDKKVTRAVRDFIVEKPSGNNFTFSDIAFISSYKQLEKGAPRDIFSKPEDSFDLEIIPHPTNDIFINRDTLKFYVEFYNANKLFQEKRYDIQARIKQSDNFLPGYIDKDGSRTSFRNFFEGEFDIRDLQSQTYFLIIDILNSSGDVLHSTGKKFIVINQRVEPEFDRYVARNDQSLMFNEYSEKELDKYLKTLIHISTEQEISFIDALMSQRQDSYQMKKNFLFNFWSKRLRKGQTVAKLWRGYRAGLEYVNQEFNAGSHKEGWETDRGRIFLRYGIPSDVRRFPAERDIIPYEIWVYDRLGAQTNVEFVFADSDLVTNDYQLIHSSKYEEINNPNWRGLLLNRGRVPGNIDFENTLNSPFRRNDIKLGNND